jgi:hypothetical protein
MEWSKLADWKIQNALKAHDYRSHSPFKITRIMSLYWHMTGEVIIQLPDHVSILSYDRSHHPATQIMSLCCHMTGEVIIQLSGSCLYTVIWQEKSSSSYPIMSLYCHMTGEVIIQLPDHVSYCHMTEVNIQLPDTVYTVIWLDKSSSSYPIMSLYCHMTGEVIIQLPDHVSILLYDWRSHHPAIRSCLYNVIW